MTHAYVPQHLLTLADYLLNGLISNVRFFLNSLIILSSFNSSFGGNNHFHQSQEDFYKRFSC